jgi:RNA polymerase sigma-70 factor, ECF subfamily
MTVMAAANPMTANPAGSFREPATAVRKGARRAAGSGCASDGAEAGRHQERMRTLYQIHGESLIRACLHWTRGDRQGAEDLMQETMLRAWRNLDKFDCEPAALRPWLMTVAQRIAIDMFRARSTRPPESEDNCSLEWLIESSEPLGRIHDRDMIRVALRGLSQEQRVALCHVYVLDQTIPETARRLGVPEGTVKSRVHYGLRALRDTLGTEASPPPARACTRMPARRSLSFKAG